jgi:hypothetical protein
MPLIAALGAPYDRVWTQLVDEHGPGDGARRFARILALIVERGVRAVTEQLTAALAAGEPPLVALGVPGHVVTPRRALDLPRSPRAWTRR